MSDALIYDVEPIAHPHRPSSAYRSADAVHARDMEEARERIAWLESLLAQKESVDDMAKLTDTDVRRMAKEQSPPDMSWLKGPGIAAGFLGTLVALALVFDTDIALIFVCIAIVACIAHDVAADGKRPPTQADFYWELRRYT